jgi:nucleotidyltransferase substrate binding protein (TIGR01987 family)
MGTSTSAPKDIFRELAQSGYISDVGFWLNAIDHRNLSAHTYKEDLAEKVYDFCKLFLPEAKKLLKKFETK